MSPIKKVRAATKEELEEHGHGRGSKYDGAVKQIKDLFDQGQQAVVEVELGEGETEAMYRSGIILTLGRKGVKDAKVSKIDSEGDKNLTFRVRKDSE